MMVWARARAVPSAGASAEAPTSFRQCRRSITLAPGRLAQCPLPSLPAQAGNPVTRVGAVVSQRPSRCWWLLDCPLLSAVAQRAKADARAMTIEFSHRVDPAEMDRIALAREQRDGLVERQAHHIGVGTDQLDHETPGQPLHRVATGLAAPFAGREIGLDVLLREPPPQTTSCPKPLTH